MRFLGAGDLQGHVPRDVASQRVSLRPSEIWRDLLKSGEVLRGLVLYEKVTRTCTYWLSDYDTDKLKESNIHYT